MARRYEIWTYITAEFSDLDKSIERICKLQWTTHTLLPYKELHFWNEFQCTGVRNRHGINYWKCYCLLWWEKLQICEAFIAMAITKSLHTALTLVTYQWKFSIFTRTLHLLSSFTVKDAGGPSPNTLGKFNSHL